MLNQPTSATAGKPAALTGRAGPHRAVGTRDHGYIPRRHPLTHPGTSSNTTATDLRSIVAEQTLRVDPAHVRDASDKPSCSWSGWSSYSIRRRRLESRTVLKVDRRVTWLDSPMASKVYNASFAGPSTHDEVARGRFNSLGSRRVTMVAKVLIWAGGSSFRSLSILTTAWKGPAVAGALSVRLTCGPARNRLFARRPAARSGSPPAW